MQQSRQRCPRWHVELAAQAETGCKMIAWSFSPEPDCRMIAWSRRRLFAKDVVRGSWSLQPKRRLFANPWLHQVFNTPYTTANSAYLFLPRCIMFRIVFLNYKY
eukprot:TRINITY_DN39_c0_g1_i12.p3 TRINITY_DN39_c0_g1~~TRINITY_DN39_c0_g1_i12.p3  ORF type:complete len:104 (-),score=3.07 TRINITY_DN39_c0_g1_i12:1114-1425(-)